MSLLDEALEVMDKRKLAILGERDRPIERSEAHLVDGDAYRMLLFGTDIDVDEALTVATHAAELVVVAIATEGATPLEAVRSMLIDMLALGVEHERRRTAAR